MDAGALLIQNILSIVLFLGGPILPLLLIALAVDRWHDYNQDPDEALFEESHEH